MIIPVGFLGGAAVFVVGGGLRLGGRGGSGAGLRTGEFKNAVGDGITIVSILITFYIKT